MNVDVPLGLWLVGLTATGFVTVVACAGILPSAERGDARRLAGVLVAWLAADVALGLAGAFAASPDTRVPFIGAGIAIPLVAGVMLLTRPGTVQRVLSSVPLHRLVGVQFYRAAGVIFLVAWAAGRMPAVFALPAGIGDIAVGLAAPIVAARLRSRLRPSAATGWVRPADRVTDDLIDARARRLAVAWNLAGIADLVLAVSLGFFSSPSAFEVLSHGDPNALVSRMPFVLIPTFAVPLSIVLHVAALMRLRGTADVRGGVSAPGPARA